MKDISFYMATGRNKINNTNIAAAQDNYSYNYLKLLPSSRNARIIDFGCSEGLSLGWLLMNGYQNIVGVDSDKIAINIAKHNFRSILQEDQIVCQDVLTCLNGCENNSVDMFLMFNLIEHISKVEILDITSEIRRVLKEDGHLLIQTGNWENPFNLPLFTRDFTHQVMYTQKSLRQLMIMSKFSKDNIRLHPVQYKTTFRNSPLLVLAPLAGWLVKMFALCMRIHIHETSPLIYCLVKK